MLILSRLACIVVYGFGISQVPEVLVRMKEMLMEMDALEMEGIFRKVRCWLLRSGLIYVLIHQR